MEDGLFTYRNSTREKKDIKQYEDEKEYYSLLERIKEFQEREKKAAPEELYYQLSDTYKDTLCGFINANYHYNLINSSWIDTGLERTILNFLKAIKPEDTTCTTLYLLKNSFSHHLSNIYAEKLDHCNTVRSFVEDFNLADDQEEINDILEAYINSFYE